MIESSIVYQAFGVSENAGHDGYIQVTERIQLFVQPDKLTLIYADVQPDESGMREALTLGPGIVGDFFVKSRENFGSVQIR